MADSQFVGYLKIDAIDAIKALEAAREDARRIMYQQVERAAMALYEYDRDGDDLHTGEEWDWSNIDRSYDNDDETDTDPEWLRNRYRELARVALDAA